MRGKHCFGLLILSTALSLCLCFALFGCDKTPAEPSAGEGKTAIYIYMCGSDLETKQSAATGNIAELLSAKTDENTSVFVQTGGAATWRGYGISSDFLTRFEVKDGVLKEEQRLANASMGEEKTFADFVEWCLTKHPAERSALILWDHGGGALGNVCYDENFGMDALAPAELRSALEKHNAHFDVIGFDACLMATNETAALMKDFADLMLASEEIETAGGWDHKAFVEAFSSKKSVEEACKATADAYIGKCKRYGGGDMTTLSVFDLKKYDDFSVAFENFARSLKQASDDRYGNFNIVRASSRACKFGAASRDEGASNLIDLYGFANAMSADNEEASALTRAIESFVPYAARGDGRVGVGGVSLYYPLWYEPDELNVYLAMCSSEQYKSYLEDVYSNVVGDTLRFEDAGSEGEDGSFNVSLTQESRRYLKSVEFSLLGFFDDDPDVPYEVVQFGVDNDLSSDWGNLAFKSNFRGVWLALDGVYLNFSVVESNEDYILFSAPVKVNGARSNLRFMFVWDDSFFNGGYYKIIGLWSGLDANNLADKQIVPLQEGDRITVLRKSIDPAQDRTIEDAELSDGETVVIGKDGGEIGELPLKGVYFSYVFIATDIFGNRFYSNTARLEMKYTYDELLANPLPDGEYAADIVAIEWNSFWGAVG